MAFKPGDPNINRAGRPKNAEIDQLRRALETEGIARGQDFWTTVAKKAFVHDKIMVAVLKKLIPDLTHADMAGEIKYTSMQMIRIEHKPLSLDLGEDIPESIKERMNDRAAEDSANA